MVANCLLMRKQNQRDSERQSQSLQPLWTQEISRFASYLAFRFELSRSQCSSHEYLYWFWPLSKRKLERGQKVSSVADTEQVIKAPSLTSSVPIQPCEVSHLTSCLQWFWADFTNTPLSLTKKAKRANKEEKKTLHTTSTYSVEIKNKQGSRKILQKHILLLPPFPSATN